MSASTTDREMMRVEDGAKIRAFPMQAAKVVYKGRKAAVIAGYLENLTAANVHQAEMIVIPIESYDNTSGAVGAISGDLETGERVVKCYTECVYREDAGSGFAQAKVGLTAFATNNTDVVATPTAGARPIGTIVKYVSATVAYIKFGYDNLVEKELVVALTAAGDNTAGGVLSLANPFGVDLLIKELLLDITTAPTDTAGGVDAGIAANGTTSSDTLIDGAVLATAKVYNNVKNAGTNGASAQKWGSSQYLTISSVVGSHYDLAAMVGKARIKVSLY